MEKYFFPDEVDISNILIGSDLQHNEFEIILRNIVVISRSQGQWFKSFTFKEYKSKFNYELKAEAESKLINELNDMAQKGFLKLVGSRYWLTQKTFDVYQKFLKIE